MKKYIILAESGADLPKKYVDQYGIYVVPMHVGFGEDTRDDGTFPVTDVFDFYKSTGSLTKTSGCNIGDFEAIFDRIHTDHPDSKILYLAYSAATTCSYQSALLASEDRDYIIPFDTKFCSSGQGFIVLMMARYLEQHPDATEEEVIAHAKDCRSRAAMCFLPGDLKYLHAGGRLSNAAFVGAKILSINPLIEIKDGLLVGTKKYRGKTERIYKKVMKEFIENNQLAKDSIGFVFSRGLSEEIKQSAEAEALAMGFKEVIWFETGSVVSTHSGPGAFGVCGMR